MLFSLVLLLEGEVDILKFVFEHFVFVIESLANFIQFLVLFSVLLNFLFLRKAFFGKLSNLDFVIGSIEELSLAFFKFDSQQFDLLGKAFYLNGLEDHDELYIISKVGLAIVGKVLDTGPKW